MRLKWLSFRLAFIFLKKQNLPCVWDTDEKPNDDYLLLSRPVQNVLYTDKLEQAEIWNDYFERFMRKNKLS